MSIVMALILAQSAIDVSPSPSATDVAPAEDIVVTARRLNWFAGRVQKDRPEDPWRCVVKNSSGIEKLDDRLCQGMIRCAIEMEPRFHSPEALAAARQSDEGRRRYLREYGAAAKPCYKRERRATLAELRAQRRAVK